MLRLTVCLLFAFPPAARAQETGSEELPRSVAESAVAFYNRATTTRLTGDSRLPAGAQLAGDLVVLDGTLALGGHVRGSVLVINGDALLDDGAVVEGDLTVIGGIARMEPGVRVGGTVTQHATPLRYSRDETDDLVVVLPRGEVAIVAGRDFEFGRTDLRVAVRGAYNRVEGLPVSIGPRISIGRSNPSWLEGYVILRTAAGLGEGDLGYLLRAEQYLGGHLAARFGVAVRSEIQPIEEWELSDRESSLSTFLLRRDFRDHYERRGWSAYLRLAPRQGPNDLTLEFRDERHEAVPVREPWTLTGNDGPWRPQPVVAEGTLRSVVARWTHDSRNEVNAPAHGWLLRAEVEQALGGTLTSAVTLQPDSAVVDAAAVDRRFSTMSLDLRRYARTGPWSRMAIRLLAAGSLDGGALPPQRQHVLGGAGSLPAYDLFNFDCGARAETLSLDEETVYPYYGCDRAVLVQLEYHASLHLGRSLGRRLGWDIDLGDTPGLVLFFDAGRAWTESDAREGRSGGLDDFKADAGAGIRLGRIGAYWAVPLSGRADRINFFVRVGPRL